MAKGEPGRKGPPAKAFSQSEKDYAWLKSKLTLQPNGVGGAADRAHRQARDHCQEKYIRAPKYPQAAFDQALAECKADKTWQTIVNENTGHDVMIDQPEWLAETVLKAS